MIWRSSAQRGKGASARQVASPRNLPIHLLATAPLRAPACCCTNCRSSPTVLPLPHVHRRLQVYLASYFATQVAVKVLLVGHVASASDAERALTLSTPIL